MIAVAEFMTTVRCTAPFTLDDTKALAAMLKPLAPPGEPVEVYDVDGYGETIRVTVGKTRWELPVC